MRAVWYTRTGSAAEVLVQGELPTPEPGAGEVRVRLKASGVNPADCNRRRGQGYTMEAPLVIPHSDGAGIVDAVGDGISRDLIGQRVWLYNGQRGRPFGTAAEAICLDRDLISALPDGVTFEEGACLGIPCMTAHRALFCFGAIADKTVLVSGGAGAVGNYAIQLGKWAGARVICSVSDNDKAGDAKAAGADVVIDYRREDLVGRVLEETGGTGVDHFVDVDFGGNIANLARIVMLNGTIAAYASRGNATPAFPFYELMRRNLGIQLVFLATAPIGARRQAQADISRFLEAPRLHRIAARFPLAQTASAHEIVEAGGKRGTVVVVP